MIFGRNGQTGQEQGNLSEVCRPRHTSGRTWKEQLSLSLLFVAIQDGTFEEVALNGRSWHDGDIGLVRFLRNR